MFLGEMGFFKKFPSIVHGFLLYYCSLYEPLSMVNIIVQVSTNDQRVGLTSSRMSDFAPKLDTWGFESPWTLTRLMPMVKGLD